MFTCYEPEFSKMLLRLRGREVGRALVTYLPYHFNSGMRQMKRTLGMKLAGATAAILAGAVGVVLANPLQQQDAAKPKLAEEQYKNITTLKGIPAEQVIPTMQFISNSLGVECSYCHVERQFDKDDKKPKL